MKSYFFIASLSLSLIACNQNATQNEAAALNQRNMLLTDSINKMKELQAKTELNALKRKDSLLSDSLKRMNSLSASKVIASKREINKVEPSQVRVVPKHSHVKHYPSSAVGSYSDPNTTSNNAYNNPATTPPSTAPSPTSTSVTNNLPAPTVSAPTSQAAIPAKKGWSDAAKGTAIGAGGGAIAGALIDKRHGQGAIIGGLVGAGAGFLFGRSKDKKAKAKADSAQTQPK